MNIVEDVARLLGIEVGVPFHVNEENLSINKTDEKGVVFVTEPMTKEEALKYVVAFSCCTVGGLSCEDCPFNDMESCLPLSDELMHDAVMTLKSDKQLEGCLIDQ